MMSRLLCIGVISGFGPVALLVGVGAVLAKVLSPAGAALYNFLTDFLPPLNAAKLFRSEKVLSAERRR